MDKKDKRNKIFYIWLGWFLVLLLFQNLVTARLEVRGPDYAVEWSEHETLPSSNRGKIYLLEPFLNRQVAWDSEYYVGIAVAGYEDPEAGAVRNPFTGELIIKNYSFFPFYPYVMRIFMFPLQLLGKNPIATSSLAGVIVSLLGTLAGLYAIYDLASDQLDADGRLRVIFYLLIFPTSFFFAMVYTEGLFIGLAFWCLVLSKRRQWFWASILAGAAAWTRAHGAALGLALVAAWLMDTYKEGEIARNLRNWKWYAQGIMAFLPAIAYLIWRSSELGQGWAELQTFYFGRGLLTLESSFSGWKRAFLYARYMEKEALIYYLIEVITILLAFISSLWLIRREPPAALFSLSVVLLSVFSGAAQSMARYMLIVPSLFIFLAWLGKRKSFDRVWTIASLLLMGMEAMLFAFDMWVG
jgi:hypothetical protein